MFQIDAPSTRSYIVLPRYAERIPNRAETSFYIWMHKFARAASFLLELYGQTELAWWLVGGVADKLIRGAAVPVLLVSLVRAAQSHGCDFSHLR
jgi:hypothetical protein